MACFPFHILCRPVCIWSPLQRFPFCVVYTSDPSPAGNLDVNQGFYTLYHGALTDTSLSLWFLDLSEQTSLTLVLSTLFFSKSPCGSRPWWWSHIHASLLTLRMQLLCFPHTSTHPCMCPQAIFPPQSYITFYQKTPGTLHCPKSPERILCGVLSGEGGTVEAIIQEVSLLSRPCTTYLEQIMRIKHGVPFPQRGKGAWKMEEL